MKIYIRVSILEESLILIIMLQIVFFQFKGQPFLPGGKSQEKAGLIFYRCKSLQDSLPTVVRLLISIQRKQINIQKIINYSKLILVRISYCSKCLYGAVLYGNESSLKVELFYIEVSIVRIFLKTHLCKASKFKWMNAVN